MAATGRRLLRPRASDGDADSSYSSGPLSPVSLGLHAETWSARLIKAAKGATLASGGAASADESGGGYLFFSKSGRFRFTDAPHRDAELHVLGTHRGVSPLRHRSCSSRRRPCIVNRTPVSALASVISAASVTHTPGRLIYRANSVDPSRMSKDPQRLSRDAIAK